MFDQDAAQAVHGRAGAVALIARAAAGQGHDPVNCIECQVRPQAARLLVEGVGLTGMLRDRFASLMTGCKLMHSFFAVVAAFGMLLLAPRAEAQPAATRGETIVILDMSASMWGRIGDKLKLEIAREVIRNMFSRFPATSLIGLMAHGHRQAGQCSDIQMLFPPGLVNATVAGGALDRLTARGKTPLN